MAKLEPLAPLRVFVSHASKDKPFVRRLVTDLTEHGIEVFFDEKDIVPGQSIPRRLSGGIENSDSIIVVLSASFHTSTWSQDEFEAALMLKKHVVPVILEACEIPVWLRSRSNVDFRPSVKYEDSLRQLIKGVEASRSSGGEFGGQNHPQHLSSNYLAILMLLSVVVGGVATVIAWKPNRTGANSTTIIERIRFEESGVLRPGEVGGEEVLDVVLKNQGTSDVLLDSVSLLIHSSCEIYAWQRRKGVLPVSATYVFNVPSGSVSPREIPIAITHTIDSGARDHMQFAFRGSSKVASETLLIGSLVFRSKDQVIAQSDTMAIFIPGHAQWEPVADLSMAKADIAEKVCQVLEMYQPLVASLEKHPLATSQVKDFLFAIKHSKSAALLRREMP